MRVLFLNAIARIGGAERCLLTMFDSLRRADPSIDLHLLTFDPGPLIEASRTIGVTTHVVPMPPSLARLGEQAARDPAGIVRAIGSTPAFLARLRRSVRQTSPDVIHSNNMKTHLLSGGCDLGAPVCWHLHDFVSNRRIMKPLLRASARRVRKIIAISRAVAADARRTLPRTPVEVIHNAVDVDRFSPGDSEPAIFGPSSSGRVRVGLAATYARWKGQDVFLRAIASLPRELPADFFIVGGPIYQTVGSQFSVEELQQMAQSLGIIDRVTFVGFQSDMPAVNRSLDVVVHASTHPEPFGLTIAEAMSCGRAVIAVKAGGASEIFIDRENAIGIEMGDSNSLARAIEILVRDTDLRSILGERARRHIEERFQSNRLGSELLEIYRSVL